MKIKEIINNEKTFNINLEVLKSEFGTNIDIFDDFILLNKNSFDFDSKIVKRGKKESTLYLLIPKLIKDSIKFKRNEIFKNVGIKKLSENEFIISIK